MHFPFVFALKYGNIVNRAGIPGTILQVYLDSADFHKVLQNCVVIGEVLAYSARIVSV